MTYLLHAHLKSNPEGSIDLWVSEKEKSFFVKGLTESANFEKMMKEWKDSFVCFPTLPEQQDQLLQKIVSGLHKSGLDIPLSEFTKDGFDVDPGLFEFEKVCAKCNLKYNEPLIVNVCHSCGDLMDEYAVLKSTPAQEEDLATLEELFTEHQIFAAKQFPESTYVSSLRGLEREIKEVEAAKFDYYVIDGKDNRRLLGLEYADCFMYLLDSANRNGFEVDELKTLFAEKLKINKARQWKKNDDDSYSHVK